MDLDLWFSIKGLEIYPQTTNPTYEPLSAGLAISPAIPYAIAIVANLVSPSAH